MGLRSTLLALLLVACAASSAQAEDQLPGADAEALRVLKGLPREWAGTSARDCKTYEDKNIDRLSRAFAVSAAGFLKAFVEVHGHVTITSAHRTVQEQACVCEGEKGPCAGRPRVVKLKKGRRRIVRRGTSRHQSGIALDVRAGMGTEAEFLCMHEFAKFNPQFGVHFPMGKRDKPHMEPSAGGGSRKTRLAGLAWVQPHVTPCAAMKVMLVDTPLD